MSGWHPQPGPGETIEPLVVRSRGYLVQETRQHTVIAQSVASNGQLADILTIPRGWIRRLRGRR